MGFTTGSYRNTQRRTCRLPPDGQNPCPLHIPRFAPPRPPTQAYPLDLLRTRMAAETSGTDYRRLLPALRRIAGEQGVRGLYKGLGATLVQVGGERQEETEG